MSTANEMESMVRALPSNFMVDKPQAAPQFGIGRIQPQARFSNQSGALPALENVNRGFGADRFLQGGFTESDLTPPQVHINPGGIFGNNPDITRLLARQGVGAASGANSQRFNNLMRLR